MTTYYNGKRLQVEDDKCSHCDGCFTPAQEPDPCLGWLPGVAYACCGHGFVDDCYVKFHQDHIVLRWGLAVRWIETEHDCKLNAKWHDKEAAFNWRKWKNIGVRSPEHRST